MIRQRFDELRSRGDMALVAYLTGGFPTMETFVEHLKAVADGGADVIEIGVPFSDPVADGPTIQFSSHAALEAGVTLRRILDAVADLEPACPLAIMSYLNPLMAFGRDELLSDMNASRISGMIVPDLAVEESDEWLGATRSAGIELIFLAAPTSTAERIAMIAQRSEGFIYAVSLAGTTGVRDDLAPGLPEFLGRIRSQTDKPVAVGFGISKPEQIRSLHGKADGVVVGSRLINAIRNHEDLAGLVACLKEATRS